MTNLFEVSAGKLKPVTRASLATEDQIETWVAENPGILGLGLLIIGRQVTIESRGRLDLLGLDSSGNLVILELKRDRTPREIVAQVLDYASWVVGLTTRDVHDLANKYLARPLPAAFQERFDRALPENLNGDHQMVIIASELDATTTRIVEYLSERHDLSINTALFRVFQDGDRQLLATDWQLDPEQVEERSATKVRAPWTGYWYVNVGEDHRRSWEDMRRYSFVSAGGGRFYSGRLDQLSVGDKVFAYQKGQGYVGYGEVVAPAVIAKDFQVDGVHLLSSELVQPGLASDKDDEELAEYAVAVRWIKTFPMAEAKTFRGVFANQNIVCKLRDAATLEFLSGTFGVTNGAT
jgi:endonuclease NucS-like protein